MKLNQTVIVLLLVFSCIGCDQSTKWIAKTRLPKFQTISLAGDLARLQYAENPGAFLSLGASLPENWRRTLFTTGAGALLLALLVYILFVSQGGACSQMALSLVCGGGLSNFYDRFAHGGCLVNFLKVGIGPLRTGIFNVADMAILLGIVVLALSSHVPSSPGAI